MVGFVGSPLLKTGYTRAFFKQSGYAPDDKLSLKQFQIIPDNTALYCLSADTGTLSTPVALELSNVPMMLITSDCVAGLKNIDLSDNSMVLNLLILPSDCKQLAKSSPTDVKKLLNTSPTSPGSVTRRPSTMSLCCLCSPVLFPNASFTWVQNTLGSILVVGSI